MQYTRLTQCADVSIDFGSRVPSWQALRQDVQNWWQRTSDKSFLGNPNSRRDVRVVLLPLTYFGAVSTSLFYPTVDFVPSARLCAAISLVVCIAFCLPTDSLWSDALYSVAGFMFSVGWVVINPSLDPQSFVTTAFHSMAGIHSLHITVYLVATSIAYVFVFPAGLFDNVYSCIILVIHFVVENRSARQCDDLDRECQARQYLLDGASQGWCDVSTADGVIRKSGSGLPAMLGHQNLVEQRLAGFVRGTDVQRVDELCLSAEGQGTLTPFLITCHTFCEEFDAKIIPYGTLSGIVKVCIQVQGERRRRHAPFPSRATEGGDDASEFALSADSISQPSAFRTHTSVPTSMNVAEVATQTDPMPQQTQPVALQSMPPAMQGMPPAGQGRPPAGQGTLPAGQGRPPAGQGRPPAMQGRPVELPQWMSARTESSGSENDAASERSVGSGGGRRRRRGRLLITFTNQPLLPTFMMTPESILENSVNWFIVHWNIPRPKPRNMCCEYHAAYQCLSLLTRKMMTTPCQAGWTPNSGWQCPHCFLMHENLDDDCDLCRASREQSSSEDSSSHQDPTDGPARRALLSL